jgi:hypothetical protein
MKRTLMLGFVHHIVQATVCQIFSHKQSHPLTILGSDLSFEQGKCLTKVEWYVIQKVDKLKSICLHYAIATQWLIPALFRGESFDSQEPAFNSKKVAKKGYKSQWARQAADDTNFKTTVGYCLKPFSILLVINCAWELQN